MPLPLLLVPLGIAGGSAVAQVFAKLRARRKLTELKAELETLQAEHREQMQALYDQQTGLCLQLGLPEPELPEALHEPDPVEIPETPPPRWRRLLKRRRQTLADGPIHSRTRIVGQHAFSFTAGTIWRTSSGTILNVVRPVGTTVVRPVLGRVVTIVPRFAAVGGGAGGSVAASTGIRFAVGTFGVVGVVLGPALTARAIIIEIRRVQKAKRELEEARARFRDELAEYSVNTQELEKQLEAAGHYASTLIGPLTEPAPPSSPVDSLHPASPEASDGVEIPVDTAAGTTYNGPPNNAGVA